MSQIYIENEFKLRSENGVLKASNGIITSIVGTSSQIIDGTGSLQLLTTSIVPEGSNVYFTNARAQAAITGSSPISVSAGVVSIPQSSASVSGYLSYIDWVIFNNKQNALGFTPENVANKSNSTTLGNSTILYPTQNAVKSYVDTTVQGGIILQGDWNASTNSPNISGTTTTGFAWRVSVDGSTNLGGITDWKVGDLAVKSASSWIKIDNTDNVTSVFGRFGTVVAQSGDYTTDQVTEATNLYFTNARSRSAISLTTTGTSGAATYNSGTGVLNIPSYIGGVTSVNGQTGAVSLTTDNIPEGVTNLYYLDSRARAALSFAAGSGAYNSTTGVITIPTNTSQLTNGANYITLGSISGTAPIQYNNTTGAISITQATTSTNGYLSSTDWNTFNSRLSSVGLSMPSAFTVTNSPLTSNGVISVTGAGIASQYVRGDGTLANFPTSGGGGGASVSYYLNGSINQGTIGGVTYYEMNKTPVIGAGTDFSINANGYIASFLTDAGDPALLNIPSGNWNFEMFFSASSGGGTPSFYVELYKYDGTTFTLISSGSTVPESITAGTAIDLYTTALTVTSTTLTLTDRLAVRVYVNNSGRTITLHTEDNHLCQIITTFTTGLTALNGLTAQVQYFQTGTSGTDFNISSTTATHTFNLPTASASNRGALSSANWTTFNNKQNAITLTTTGSNGASTLVGATLNVPNYTLSGLGGVPTSRTLTINGVAYDLSADRAWTITAGVSSVTASSPLFSSGGSTPNITIQQANVSQNGFLSSTDWSTFNSKQSAITLTTTGTSGAATFVSNTLNIPNYGSALTAYVPYTGATSGVNLGAFNLAATRVNINGATDNSLFSLNNGGGTLYTNGFSPNATYYSTAITLGGGTSYVYNGSGNITWSLPTPSGNNQVYFIRNASTGSGTITLNAFSALGIIDNTNAAVSSISIAAGATVIIQQDGTAKSYQLNSASGSGNPVALIAVSGTQNSVNKTFTLASAPTSTTNQFFINGQLMTYTEDYTLSGSTITIAADRPAPSPTDALLFYGSLGSGGGGGGGTVDELQVALISQVYG